MFGKLYNMKIRFAENLKMLRISRKITQAQLGEWLGVDQRTISAWEKGVCEPSFDCLEKLCDIFEESLDGLLL